MKLNLIDQSRQYSINQVTPEKGFTLIELLLVLLVIGILSAITLPRFPNEAGKAKQSEVKAYLASINKRQQAYFDEKGVFAKSIDALGLGIKTQTTNYNYSIRTTKDAAFSYAIKRSLGLTH